MNVGFVETPSSPALERFFSLIRRDLGAVDVRVVGSAQEVPQSGHTMSAVLPDERVVVVVLGGEPSSAERDVLERRLGMLVDSFAEALEPKSEPIRIGRANLPTSLHEELRALAARARATDVVVIDVDSPVVWGSALAGAFQGGAHEQVVPPEVSRPQLVSIGSGDGDSGPLPEDAPAPAESPDEVRTKNAIEAVRKLPYVNQAHKGRHFRHAQAEGDLGYLALSFSGIYVMIVVFAGEFDELRAERAATDALPRIERLVLALPPFDPEPTPIGDALALRKPRRR